MWWIKAALIILNTLQEKLKDNLGKPVLLAVLLEFVKEIVFPFNLPVSGVYDLSTDVKNHHSLLHNHECVVKGISFLMSLCGYFQV